MGEASRRRRSGLSRLVSVAGLGLVVVASGVAAAIPAAAASGIGVFVGYADSVRANPTNFPTPWAGSPNTIFKGCTGTCTFDAGAVQIVNNSGAPVTVDAIAVHVGSCTFSGWSSALLPNGGSLVVTQTSANAAEGCGLPGQLDSSDIGILPNCAPDGIQPVVDVTINGTKTPYTDSGQVLNTGGIDWGVCVGNESIQWTKIGSQPCRGSVLSLAPPSQTRGVGTTASVTATFTNICPLPQPNQPLQNVSVQFHVLTGPNAGRTGTGTTNASGQAVFSYSGTVTGNDTLGASVTNVIGTLTSDPVTVTWVAFAPGGGAFVISDSKDIKGQSVYWWGAQWWKNDLLSSGLAPPASFKGFENGDRSPWCGQTWTARPGNSSKPPRTVSAYMAVIVASHVVKRGPVISGDIVNVVLVRTNPGYGPNPGHPGTGTIVATLC